MSYRKLRKAAGTWWNRCSALTRIQQGREDWYVLVDRCCHIWVSAMVEYTNYETYFFLFRILMKAPVILLLYLFLTMQQISIHWSRNQLVQWGKVCCQLIVVFTRYNKHTLTLFFSCFPTLASHFYRNSHEDCNISGMQTMWAAYLASTNNTSIHCSLSSYSNLPSSFYQATNAHISQ